jgi:hypothetical protein
MRREIAFLLLGLVCGATAAAEIGNELVPPDLERYERWGALRARPRLEIRNVGWDSNVFNTIEQTGDFRATVAPGLEGLVLFGEVAFLTFDSEFPYTAYSRYEELNFLDLLNSARFFNDTATTEIYTEGRFDRVRKTPVDLDDVRPVYTTEKLGLGAILETSDRTEIELAHGHWRLTHGDDDFDRADVDISERLDRVEREDRLTFRYQMGGRSQLSVAVSNLDIEFDTSNISGIPGLNRDSRARAFLPGLTLGQGERLVGQLEVGYAELVYDSSFLPGYSGTVGRGELRYRPFRGMTWTLEGEREVDFAASEGNNYFVYDSVRLNTLYFFNSVLGIEIDLNRGTLEFPVTNRVDNLFHYGGGIRIRAMEDALGRRVEYRVKLVHRQRESTDPLRDRSRSVLNFDVVFGY